VATEHLGRDSNGGRGVGDMVEDYEGGRDKLERLIEWYDQRVGDRNEATTRLHLIDTLFFECLGWPKESVEAEESSAREYADYTFRAPRRMLIVEAKREGIYFELPAGIRGLYRAIPSLCKDYEDLKKAIEQAAGYCQHRGVPLGAVCNGHQLIAFIACRSDGVSPLDGRALVFSCLEDMRDNFRMFWDALSKPGVEDKRLVGLLIGDAKPRLPAKLSASIRGYPGVKGRNVFQTDLQILTELVIEDVPRSPDLETRFLKECYSQSGAISQHSLLAKQILQARYAALFAEPEGGPSLIPATTKDGITPELFAESISRRPIILLGDIGVGKTTFIRNLILVEAAPILVNGIALHLDLGAKGILAMDLREFILDEIARQLREKYGVDIDERNFVRSIYNLEIQRFRKSIYGDLEASDKAAFRQHEIAFLEQKLQKREEHVKYALLHVSRGQSKQIVLFLDNADQRTEEVQEQAFLMSEEISQTWPVTVFVALRPSTFHRSLRSGSLSGYHPKAFTISPPRVDRVIESRLKFCIEIASGRIPLESLGPGIKIKLHALERIMRSFLESLEQPDGLIEFIDNIAGGNIRLALDLVRQFFGSGHVDTQKIVDKQGRRRKYYIPLHEFLRAVIYGDAIHYDPRQSYVANVFDVTEPDGKEHFLLCTMIGFLHQEGLKGSQQGFVDVGRTYERLQSLGFTADQIDRALVKAVEKKLIETGGRELPQTAVVMPEVLRASSVGIYHVDKLTRLFSYVDAMIVDTPVLDDAVRDQMLDVETIEERLHRARVFKHYLDERWSGFNPGGPEFDWRAVSRDLEADIALVEEKRGL
jgi:hypothetical protein